MRDEDVEELFEALIGDGPFDAPRNQGERMANDILAKMNEMEDEDDRELMHDELRTAVAVSLYHGHDPKFMDRDVMLHCIQNPVEAQTTFIHPDARRRVKNPNSAIRAKCLECQGNDQVGVRQCPSINCFLWPFRMQGNPFYGRLVNSTGEEEAEDTEQEMEEFEAAFEQTMGGISGD